MMVNKLLLQVVITTLTILLIQIRTVTAQSCGANQCYVAKYGFCFPLSSDLCMSQATPATQQQLAPPEESPLSAEDATTPYAFDWNFTRADEQSSPPATGINTVPWWGWACIVAACLLLCICINIECGCRSCNRPKRVGAQKDSVKSEKETMNKNHMVVMKLDRSMKDANDDKSKRPPRKKRESSTRSKKKPTSRSNNHRPQKDCPDEWHRRHRYCGGFDDLEAQTNETVSSDSDGSLSSPDDSIFVRMIQDEADRLERAVRDRQANSLVRSERRMEQRQRSRSSRSKHHRRSRSSRRRSKSRTRSTTNKGYDSHANSLVRLERSMERRRSTSSRRSNNRNRSTTNRRSKSRSRQQDNHKRSSSKSKSQSKGSKAKSSSARSTTPVGKRSKYLQERKQEHLRRYLPPPPPPPPPPRRHEVNRRKTVPPSPPPPAAVRSSYLKARRSSLEALTAAAQPVYEVRPENSDDPPGLRHRVHLTDTNLDRSHEKRRMKDMKSSLTGISLDTKALEVPTKTHDGNAGLFQPVSNASFRRRSKESLDTFGADVEINYIEDNTSDNDSVQSSSSTESHEILEPADFKQLLVAIKSLKSLGDVLLYKTDEGIVEGRICHVHTDNPLEPYYTIKLPDGTELQTEASRIVNSDTSEDTDEEDIDVDAAIDQMLGFIDELQEENSTTESQQPLIKASSTLVKFHYKPFSRSNSGPRPPASNMLRSNTFRSILSDPVESPEGSPEGETSSNSSERGELVDIEARGKEDTNTSRKYNQEEAAERSLVQNDTVVASMPIPKEPIGRRSINGYLREWSELLGESGRAIVPRSNTAASDASSTTVLSDKLPEEIEVVVDIEAQKNNGPRDCNRSKHSSVSSLSKNSASTESSRSSTSCTSGF